MADFQRSIAQSSLFTCAYLLACRSARGGLGLDSMTVHSNTLSLIGNTPLVRLTGPSQASGAEIYAKCEFTNPGASVKDRAALYIIEDAEAKGQLAPGGTIVEG